MWVLGKGYDNLLDRFKNITYGGELDLDKTAAVMRSSRIVLNVNANFGAGSHERPLTAMLAGAVAASDHSTFYSNNFRENEEIILYRWMALEEGMNSVAGLANDPETAHAVAVAGQARVAANHRWDDRVDAIVAAAATAREKMLTRA
jgi:spore maturation protein CgeB